MARPFTRSISGDASARRIYDLIDEPAGADYQALIDYAVGQCAAGVLMVDPDSTPQSQQVVDRLLPFSQGEFASLGGGIFHFRLNRDSAEVLKSSASSLYEWQGPALPQNLCLMRADGSPWLVSLSSEHLAYLELGKFERLLFANSIPTVASVLADAAGKEAVLGYFERRLESHRDQMAEELSSYASRTLEDSREGVIDAIRQWLHADEYIRSTTALEVIRKLKLIELWSDVADLREEALDDSFEVPTVFRGSPVLLQRWKAKRMRLLHEVFAELEAVSVKSLNDYDESGSQ